MKEKKKGNKSKGWKRSRHRKEKRNDEEPSKESMECTFCGKPGHSESDCWQKNGYPDRSKAKGKGKNNNKGKKQRDKKRQVNALNVERGEFVLKDHGEFDNLEPAKKRPKYNNNSNKNKRVSFKTYPRYILPLQSINTTATFDENPDLAAPFLCRLRFNGFISTEPDGLYTAFLDTGSNTAAMKASFAKTNGFPLYDLKRTFTAHTANGPVRIDQACVLEIENTNSDGDRYWLPYIFYLLQAVSIDIIVSRQLMRILGFGVTELQQLKKYHHVGTTSNTLGSHDESFWEQLHRSWFVLMRRLNIKHHLGMAILLAIHWMLRDPQNCILWLMIMI